MNKKAIIVAIASITSLGIAVAGLSNVDTISKHSEQQLHSTAVQVQGENIEKTKYTKDKVSENNETETYDRDTNSKGISINGVTIKGKEIHKSDVVSEEQYQRKEHVRNIALSRGGTVREYNVVASYYTSSWEDCQSVSGVGASGKKVEYGDIAMPKEFKFGTKIYLDGIGEFTCQDRGGAIKFLNSNTIKVDIFIPNATSKQIRNMGIKKVKGFVVEQ